jgi:translation initiation factor IF-2
MLCRGVWRNYTHIGAYGVTLDNGQKIHLDTPGRGIYRHACSWCSSYGYRYCCIAADDDHAANKEAISHAQAAGVPIIFAINKVDKPNKSEKIKEKLAGMNLLVELGW